LHIIGLVKSLPEEDQRTICAALVQHASARNTLKRTLKKLSDGSYYNPDGIPNDDPIFKILEEIEEERHRTFARPAPKFD
jgi:hypothetical protein